MPQPGHRRYQVIRTGYALLAVLAMVTAGEAQSVDIAWKVLPRKVAADSFGVRVARLYYAVVAVVGNSSGRDIQVSSILFQLPQSTGIAAPIPADPYRIVRNSLERERQTGLRNSAVNVIKAAGPALAAASVFAPPAVFAQISSIFGNPFEKGFELVFPDKTIPQMAALDTLTMRDHALIANNTQQVLLAFVSRDLVRWSIDGKPLRHGRRGDFDPQSVMRALGDLVLDGKSLTYLDRVTVSSRHPAR